jgi:hypothetical protein
VPRSGTAAAVSDWQRVHEVVALASLRRWQLQEIFDRRFAFDPAPLTWRRPSAAPENWIGLLSAVGNSSMSSTGIQSSYAINLRTTVMATPIMITKGMTIGGTNAPSMNGRVKVTVLLVVRIVMACSDSTAGSMIEDGLWGWSPQPSLGIAWPALRPALSFWPASPDHLRLASLGIERAGRPAAAVSDWQRVHEVVAPASLRRWQLQEIFDRRCATDSVPSI